MPNCVKISTLFLCLLITINKVSAGFVAIAEPGQIGNTSSLEERVTDTGLTSANASLSNSYASGSINSVTGEFSLKAFGTGSNKPLYSGFGAAVTYQEMGIVGGDACTIYAQFNFDANFVENLFLQVSNDGSNIGTFGNTDLIFHQRSLPEDGSRIFYTPFPVAGLSTRYIGVSPQTDWSITSNSVNGSFIVPFEVNSSGELDFRIGIWINSNSRYAWIDASNTLTLQSFEEEDGTTVNVAFESGLRPTSEITSVVPEPASMALFGLGSLGIGVVVRRRKRQLTDAAA